MTHTYSVRLAAYDGSGSDQNPKVWIAGSVNGIPSGAWAVFWDMIQQANAVGGVAAVQAVLAPILLAAIDGPPFGRGPVYASGSIPAPVTAGASQVVCAEAMAAGSWTAYRRAKQKSHS
jgi:hypothetical protein